LQTANASPTSISEAKTPEQTSITIGVVAPTGKEIEKEKMPQTVQEQVLVDSTCRHD
jgi:hypothetical protein